MNTLNFAKAGFWVLALTTSFMPSAFAATASVSGTNLPGETQILDTKLNSWTLSAGVVDENSKTAGFSSGVTFVLYQDGVIYQENSSSLWWSWNGSTWVAVADPRVPSASGTYYSSAASLVDAAKNIWALSGGVVYENGQTAGFSSGVTELYYKGGVIYQENASDLWWDWNGSTWVSTVSPLPAASPSPKPSPSPSATPSPKPSPSPSPTPSSVAGTSVFNCSAFSTTGACGAGTPYPGGQKFYLMGAGSPVVTSSKVLLLDPNHSNHVADSMIYQAKVNVQGFTASFKFVPNEWNLTFVLENTDNVSGFDENVFVAGAGCEAGFYQAFTGAPPNNIFAMEFDLRSSLNNENPYDILPPDSTVQIYQQDESPCNPNDSQPNYVYKPKISTSPVSFLKPLVSSTNAALDYNPTGDTYSATINYDGSNVTLQLYDVTAGGACPGSKCFTHTWTSVNIPSLVQGDTAYVGLTTGTSQPTSGSAIVTDVGPTSHPLYIDSFTYAVKK